MATEDPPGEIITKIESDDKDNKTSGSLRKQTRFAEAEQEVIEVDSGNEGKSDDNKDSGFVTFTGKVKRGSHAGQEVEVHLDITEEELENLNTSTETQKSGMCGINKGPHITIFTVFCLPVAIVISLCVSFYFGALTWYNIFIYFFEERTILHKIFICPVLILTFPFTVGLSALGVAIYAGFIQISWYFFRWKMEFLDFEKGFYSWLCGKLVLPQCSPYEIVVLIEDSELERLPTKAV